MMSKVKQSKKTDRLDFKKTKILCISKNTIKKIEAQPTKPTFQSHLRMRPVSRRHSRRGLGGGSTFRRTPISRSPLDKNPMPGHLSELHPVNEVNTKGQFFRASFGKNPRFQIQLDKRPLSPGTSREASGVPCLNPRRGLTLLSPVCRDPAIVHDY